MQLGWSRSQPQGRLLAGPPEGRGLAALVSGCQEDPRTPSEQIRKIIQLVFPNLCVIRSTVPAGLSNHHNRLFQVPLARLEDHLTRTTALEHAQLPVTGGALEHRDNYY